MNQDERRLEEQSKKDRITQPDVETITLINGIECKIRPLTFKEKKEYLDLVSSLTPSSEDQNSSTDLVGTYMSAQVEIAWFLLKILNPKLTREEVEEGVNGTILKKIFEVTFFDPFGFINVK